MMMVLLSSVFLCRPKNTLYNKHKALLLDCGCSSSPGSSISTGYSRCSGRDCFCTENMIEFLLLQNRQGKTRYSRWFKAIHYSERIKTESEIRQILAVRDRRQCPFVEQSRCKLVIRQYAGLTFIAGIDEHENEMAVRELIHLIVETLDRYFGNVCELDLIFNFNKVYQLLDDCLIGGELSETSIDEILTNVKTIERLSA